MEDLKNRDKKGVNTKRMIGKTAYKVVIHFKENATETMQDKLTKIMLRELRRKSNEKKMILIKKSLTSSKRSYLCQIFMINALILLPKEFRRANGRLSF